ncbi:MAG: phosphodiester glycosidase family protein [Eubacteriales bacterium]|nr:phosphodiester glycosidase family protein [Eubacteriales bacterium]
MKNRTLTKLLAWLLAITVMLGLCACGRKSEASAASPAKAPTQAPAQTAPAPTPAPTPEPIVGELLTDDDGDGIIFYKFNYKGATVRALIVLDPSRVFIGTAYPEPTEWSGFGKTLDAMVEEYGAVAGINAGGFRDEGGGGDGWPPNGITFSRGTVFSSVELGPIAGLDRNNYMWSGYYAYEECVGFGIRDAVCFGPALIVNGEKTDPNTFESGIGARTAIGQREDGAVVMVAIDGRQGYSIGVTFEDCVDIMADKFGCINASNMDGGNSTCMFYDGRLQNRSANQAGGTRNMPDAWLVSPLPAGYMKPENVPGRIILPENPLGEEKEYAYACEPETAQRLYEFACQFAEAYYGYFGTSNSDYYYPTLLQYVAENCELKERMDLGLMDRLWVNTYRTVAENIVLNGAFVNFDGTYDVVITSDIHEYANYWTYDAPGTTLRITVIEDPGSLCGYRAVATY